MSWLIPSKNKTDKIVSYIYRYRNEIGRTKERSTKTNNISHAKDVQKKWDACRELYGVFPDEFKKQQLKSNPETNHLCVFEHIQFFLDEKSAEVKKSTIERYTQQFKPITRFLRMNGIKHIDQLSTLIMKQYKIMRLKKGLSHKTVREEVMMIKSMVKRLYEDEIIDKDPVRKWPVLTKTIPAKPERLGYYTADDISQLLEHFKGSDFYNFFATAVYTGKRFGEIKAVRVRDIDFQSGLIKFKNQKTLSSSMNAHNYCPIHQNLLGILQKAVKNSLPQAYVFPIANSRRDNWARDYLKYACNKLNIQYRRFHGVRHSFATLLLESGASLPQVSDALDHTNMITTQRYSHRKSMGLDTLNLLQFPTLKKKTG